MDAVGGVRVEEVAAFLLRARDLGEAVGVRGGAGDEAVGVAQGGELGRAGQVEVAVAGQGLVEEGTGGVAVAAQQVEDEALEVRGLGDVHGRAGGGQRVRGGAGAVDAGAEELVEDVVFVGGDDEGAQRQAHLAGDVGGAHVTEVARGHDDADRGRGVGPFLGDAQPGGHVVADLGEQARPVDGVDGAHVPGGFEVGVHVDGLDQVLAVVEDAVDGDVDDVGVEEGEHLGALEGGHAPGGGEHDDGEAASAAQCVFGGGAGVAGGGAHDGEPVAAAGELVFEEFTEELHRHVFEGGGGAVRQVGDVQVGAFQGGNGHDLRVGEGGGGVGAGRNRAQVASVDVVDEEGQDAGRHRRVALLAQDDAQLVQVGARQRRVFLGQVEAAVGRQALQQNVAEGAGGRGGASSGRNVTHGPILSECARVKRGGSSFVTF